MVQRSVAAGGALNSVTDDAEIVRELLAQVALRGAGRSICPSEVARALAADWRALMPRVREVARRLAHEGRVVITQGGEKREADGDWRGPIRIVQAPGPCSGST